MKSTIKPWVKAHIKMLHNYQVAQLPDSSWRRFLEAILFAGEERNNAIIENREEQEGFLPDVQYMAWTLHTSPTSLEDDFSRLALADLMERKINAAGQERWFVTHFEKWQSAPTPAERQQQTRALSQVRHNSVTTLSQKRDTEEEVEQEEEVEVEVEQEQEAECRAAAATFPATASELLAQAGISINRTTRPLLTLEPDYIAAHLASGVAPGLIIRRMLDGDPPPRCKQSSLDAYAGIIKR